MIRFAYCDQPNQRFHPSTGRVFRQDYRVAFRDRGFVWDDRRPDVLFCLLPQRKVIGGETPFVVCAREPSCDFTNSLLSSGSFWADDDTSILLDSPAFLSVFKDRRFRNASLLDGPRIDGRWLNNVLFEDYQRLGEKDARVEGFLSNITRQEYNSLQRQLIQRTSHVMWDFHFSPLNKMLDLSCTRPGRVLAAQHLARPLDVFCSLNVYNNQKGFELISWHRRRCLDQLNRLKGLRCKAGTKLTTFKRYQLHLMAAKISVSPWGGGAWCIRDVESILAGCVTIKPPCPWVEMAGFNDLYDSEASYFVPCRSDFEDLPEIIERVLADYPAYFAQVQEARRRLLRLRNPSRLIDLITNETRRLLESN